MYSIEDIMCSQCAGEFALKWGSTIFNRPEGHEYFKERKLYFLLKVWTSKTGELHTYSPRFFLLISMKVSQCNIHNGI